MQETNFDDRFDRLEKQMHEGFTRTEQRFVQVDERLAQVNAHFVQIDERFAKVTARMEEGFAHVNRLIETLANTCAREFTAISEHFTKVDDRLDVIEGKIEGFARRMDDEVEHRHALGERVAKLEQSL